MSAEPHSRRILSGMRPTGRVDCKKPLLDALLEEQAVLRERAAPFEKNPVWAREVIESGCARAREVAEETLDEVRAAVGALYT